MDEALKRGWCVESMQREWVACCRRAGWRRWKKKRKKSSMNLNEIVQLLEALCFTAEVRDLRIIWKWTNVIKIPSRSRSFFFFFFCSQWIHSSRFKCKNVCVPPPLSREKLHSKLQHHFVCVCLCVCVWMDGGVVGRSALDGGGKSRDCDSIFDLKRKEKRDSSIRCGLMRAEDLAAWETSRTPPPPRRCLQHGHERKISSFFF